MPEHSPGWWQHIERLYHEALEHDAASRDAFLDQACDGDDLLRQEVQSLLGFEDAARGFLEHPALAEAAMNLAHDLPARLIGRRLGGYEISTLLDTGGMGEVYRARDLRLGREVAIKVLEPTIAADPSYLRRFEEEARSASILNHPNIVTIYGVGEEGGVAFIAMELVQGRTLREQMSLGTLPLDAVLELAAQLARAIVAAHASGITHRDLKPENVMVTPEGVVKVLDFGVARRRGATSTAGGPAETLEMGAATLVGTIVGTVGYMSPEQASGSPAGPAADQFSFGAIVYEMLSGRRAFERSSRIDTITAILHSQPPPVERFNPQVPVSLRLVLRRCLEKDPARRYPNARDLEVELWRIKDIREREQRGEPSDPVPRGLTRRQVLWLGGTTTAAALAVGTSWKLWTSQKLAVLPFVNVDRDDNVDHLCIGITENMIWRISHLPLTVKPFSLVSNFAGGSIDPREVGRRLGVQTVLTGGIALRNGHLLISGELIDVASGTWLWKNSYDRSSADILAMWDEIATAIVDDGLHMRLTRDERRHLLSRSTDSSEAYEFFLRARPLQMANTETDYLAARDLLERAVGKDKKFAQAWVSLAGTYWTAALDGYARPTHIWPKVGQTLDVAAALNPRLADLHFGRALKCFFADWDWPAADREWLIARGAPDREILPEFLNVYALGRWALGNADGALRVVRQARRIDPITPSFIIMEATYLFHTGQLEAAANLYLTVINTHEDASGPHFALAEVRAAQGRFDDAIVARTKAHELEGDDADETLLSVLGKAKGEEGYRQIEKVSLLRLELPELERRLAASRYASPLDFARAYAQLGEKERAFEHLDAAFSDHAPGLVFLNVDRAWDSIRLDPRFHDAVRRVGLPAASAA